MRTLIDLNSAISQFAKRVRPMAGDRAVVRTDLDPQLSRVAASVEEIDWLLLNLAADAYDGMPGGGELTITTTHVELDRAAAVELDLTPGIYVRVQFTAAAGGMDVGATIRTIVRQMHGAVSVRSTCGTGLMVDILLPRALPASPNGSERTRKVLVVFDDPAERGLACDFLKDAGYPVLAASHGTEAEEILSGSHVDLMITDIVMPEQDTLDSILSVRAVHPGLKIIAVAESPAGHQLRTAKLLGADAVLSRPLTRGLLSAAVREQIGGGVTE
jgi:CheY-like chemotaxis protein